MSPHLQWTVLECDGRVSVVDGDIYFSPNSTRQLRDVPSIYNPIQFVEKVSTADDFQEPRWWTDDTEWMGFVPRKEVPYVGSWFSPLAIIPNRLLCEDYSLYGLAGFVADEWLNIEAMLRETCDILQNTYSLRYKLPFPPRRWDYHKQYTTFGEAMKHVAHGRDWFAMWIGLLYWSSRKVPNGPLFAEGLTPPDWFWTIVIKRMDRRRIDAIRTSQLLQNWWQIDRVGLILLHPDDALNQPRAQWFVEQSVPVWYRWGDREKYSSGSTASALITPSPEHLQVAMTWLHSSPHQTFDNAPQDDYSPAPSDPHFNDYSPASPDPQPIDNDYSPASPDPQPIDHSPASLDPPSSTTSSSCLTASDGPREQVRFNKAGNPIWHYGSGHLIWGPFFENKKKRHSRILAKETPKARQARLSRLKQPPMSSAPVFVWDWNDDTPPKFVRTAVLKADRLDTLNWYSPAQKRYNAFDNEWDCCQDWGEDLDEEDRITDDPRPPPPSTQAMAPPISQSPEWMAERLTEEVERILYRYFGFVAPIPLPAPGDKPATVEEKKSLVSTLGLHNVDLSNPFFDGPLAWATYSFLKPFTSKDGSARPSADTWDLCESNRLTLLYSKRFSAIRTIRRESETWYMFDFAAANVSVTWNIAISTVAAAFYVARLKDNLSDADVAHELVMEGIRFHTVQRLDSLVPADPELPASVDTPMIYGDYAFTYDDYTQYREHCREILASPRGRAALMRGGFVRRVALGFVKIDEVLRGPWGIHGRSDHTFIAKDNWGVEYVDDELSNEEFDTLSGLYHKFLGKDL
ncbi:hypothetical protein Agabi119p4_7078 [Agaricus bisporus var. burnettii]|uniref:Uncharacterized protein n=1 Tax=Agaricus bisporus var. burnettii TaxID=192524 RepID=A0A8H7F0Q1_AGABI|nr:hypothetical protein Agabi119p4_7078 [Agaricus bisporus var. burnettii]